MAKRFVKLMGLALVALVWLPSSFFGRHEANGPSSGKTICEQISVEAAFTVPSPIQPAQLHQFRLAGFQSWFAKKSGTDVVGAGCCHLKKDSETWTIRLLSFAPNDLLRTWQFACRTALHPRAPCQV